MLPTISLKRKASPIADFDDFFNKTNSRITQSKMSKRCRK